MPVYATAADLTAWMRAGQVVADADRKLRRASEKVDDLLLAAGAVYAVDLVGAPTAPLVAAALRDAACAVVEWWETTGDETGAGASAFQQVSIGSISLGRGYTSGGSATGPQTTTAPRAVAALRRAGLITNEVTVIN